MDFIENNFFLIALTFEVFHIARRLQDKTRWTILNPILVTIFFFDFLP